MTRTTLGRPAAEHGAQNPEPRKRERMKKRMGEGILGEKGDFAIATCRGSNTVEQISNL
jgi:hypothetical protein